MNRTQVVLGIAIVLLASYYTWSKVRQVELMEEEFQAARYFPDLEEKGLGSIKVWSKDPSFEYTLTRRGEHWFIDSNLLNVEKTHQLVHSILELSHEREMEASPSVEREREFKLHEPSYRLELFDNNGESLGAVKLGDRVPDYNHFYGQRVEGGAVHTVPAYTLGVLEEEPKELREGAILPVEVAAVLRFEASGAKLPKLVLSSPEKGSYLFEEPKLGSADESAVEKFLFRLKDLKAGRFLSKGEEAPIGEPQVSYVAEVGYTELEIVSELCERVAANPKLVYGRRYFRKKGASEPEPDTLELFVVEVNQDSELLHPAPKLFEDRRVASFDLDKVTKLEVESEGRSFSATLGKHSDWKGPEGEEIEESQVNSILWMLRDLRFETALAEAEVESTSVTITVKSQSDSVPVLRFGLLKNGKPYLRRESKNYALSDTAWSSLTEAVEKFMKTQPAANE